MKKIFCMVGPALIWSAVSAEPARASLNMEAIYTPSGIIDAALILLSLVCLLWSMRVMSLVKGGLMSKSWQMFAIGFAFLLMASLLSLGNTASLIIMPDYVFGALYLLMLITWLMGIHQAKKILG